MSQDYGSSGGGRRFEARPSSRSRASSPSRIDRQANFGPARAQASRTAVLRTADLAIISSSGAASSSLRRAVSVRTGKPTTFESAADNSKLVKHLDQTERFSMRASHDLQHQQISLDSLTLRSRRFSADGDGSRGSAPPSLCRRPSISGGGYGAPSPGSTSGGGGGGGDPTSPSSRSGTPSGSRASTPSGSRRVSTPGLGVGSRTLLGSNRDSSGALSSSGDWSSSLRRHTNSGEEPRIMPRSTSSLGVLQPIGSGRDSPMGRDCPQGRRRTCTGGWADCIQGIPEEKRVTKETWALPAGAVPSGGGFPGCPPPGGGGKISEDGQGGGQLGGDADPDDGVAHPRSDFMKKQLRMAMAF